MDSNKGLIAVASGLALVGTLMISVTFAQSYLERRIRHVVDESIAKNAEKVDVTYKNVKVSLLSRKIDINGIHIHELTGSKNFEMDVDKFEMSDIDSATLLRMATDPQHKTLPSSLRIGALGMHFTPAILGDKGSKEIADLGYQELNVSMSLGLKMNRKEKTFRFDDVNLDVADLGKISTTWAFSQIEMPSDEELQHPETLQAVMKDRIKNIAFHYADLRFEDHSLISRIDDKMKKSGKPPLSESVKGLSGIIQSRTPAKLAFLNDAFPKVQDFLSKGGAIALKAAPATDVTFVQLANPMNLMDPNAFAAQLGLSIEVTH
jgi:hypothetical protein